MDRQEWLSTNKPSMYDGTHYAFWIIRMKSYLLSLGFDICQSIVDGLTKPSTPSTYVVGKKLVENNEKGKKSSYVAWKIQSSLK